MEKKPDFAALILAAGIATLGAISLYSDKRQREKERSAFDKLDSSNLTPRQVWDKALAFGRKERLNMRGELEQANKVLDRANEMCETLEGMRKCVIMIADSSVSKTVSDPIVKHWITRFFNAFAVADDDGLDALFGDEDLTKRMGQLLAVKEQYKDWLAEIQSPPQDYDGDLRSCSFCGKSQKEVKYIIAGTSAHICEECTDLCTGIMRENRGRKLKV